MVPVLFADVLQYAFGILMSVSALLLILLVLVQRGRGGGLAGALGGMGGQSAFGTKAGDTFTKVTIAVASIWIVLCLAAVFILGQQTDKLSGDATTATSAVPGSTSPIPPADGSAPATSPESPTAPADSGSSESVPSP